MPLYEYECDACGGRFEVIQKFSEVSEQCRKCGKGPVRRLHSAPGIHFKGTGWYVTDYAQKGKSGSESSSEGKSSDGDQSAKSEKKSDTASSDTSTKTESASSTPATTTTKE